ncbi:MAG TPA: branched-chain amino acid ABC transporter permease [Candidatus Galloscillospira excrementavium]|nr:branched-chain amino acid ABC transporter permease [Candidatus Galloscillospira excrementavium]
MKEKLNQTLKGMQGFHFDLLRHENKVIVAIMAVLFLLPIFISNKVVINTFTLILLYILLASSLNVVNGYSSQFNVGQAGFYCIGAYTAAILTTRFNISFWLLLPVSGLMAALVSLLLSAPTAKLKGMYFTIVTLGFSEIVRQLCLNWTDLTQGPRGISGIPSPEFFGIDYPRSTFFYYVVFALAVIMLFCTNRVLASRVGRAWRSIREDDAAAASLGVETARYKMINLAYSAFWAGVAGCVYVFFQRFVSPDTFTLDESFNILAMNIIGGQGTLLGPIVGSVVANLITELFRSALQYRMLLYSALIILMMWLRPQGLVGAINRDGGTRLFRRTKPAKSDAAKGGTAA